MAKRIAIGVGVVVTIAVAAHLYSSSPTQSFRRLVGDPVPDSVSDVRVYGYTALAGSDQALTFRISPSDLLESWGRTVAPAGAPSTLLCPPLSPGSLQTMPLSV